MRVDYAGDTHVGMRRDHNEDNLLILPEENLFVIADGMGGHASGEIASKLAVDTIRQFFLDSSQDEEITWPFEYDPQLDYPSNRLITAVRLANLRIYQSSLANLQFRGMGTTIVATYLSGGNMYIAHAGDSRCYLMRKGEFQQLTEDHSLFNDFRKSGTMTAEDEKNFPHKNIIMRALGMKDTVEVDLQVLAPDPDDILLLCSDGLSGEVSDEQTAQILVQERSLVKACQRLVQMANEAGGRDNVTVILLRLQEGENPDLDALSHEMTRDEGATEATDEFGLGEDADPVTAEPDSEELHDDAGEAAVPDQAAPEDEALAATLDTLPAPDAPEHIPPSDEGDTDGLLDPPEMDESRKP